MKKTLSKIVAGLFILSVMSLNLTAFAATDAEAPSDVENLKGTPLNGALSLTWDAATDNIGVTGYQVHYGVTSVTEPGQSYDDFIDVGNVTNYKLSGLTNGTTYYVSAIAYDAAKNESAAWAKEVALAPNASAGDSSDTEAPQVASAEALNKEEVKIVFSEMIVLPAVDPQDAFTIDNDDTLESLIVTGAVLDEEDLTGKTIILTTEPQEVGAAYKLTVGIDIKDKAGNPIVSGTSDTALFEGSGSDKPAADAEGPKIVSVESIDNTHILVNLSELIVLSIDPSQDFDIKKESDSTPLQILGVELGNNGSGVADAAAILTTAPQEDTMYVVELSGVKDATGNVGSGFESFAGIPAEEIPGEDIPDAIVDIIPPKDVANLLATKLFDGATYLVKLSWKIPAENVGDTVEQTIYMSEGNASNYQKKSVLGADETEYEVSGLATGEYWFKITQTDQAGNESEGVITKVILSETGPEMAGLLFLSIGLGRVITRKKRK